MAVNWSTVAASVISGIVVSWPGVAIGLWISWRRTRSHVDAATEQQTRDVQQITEHQTGVLLQHLAQGSDPPSHGV